MNGSGCNGCKTAADALNEILEAANRATAKDASKLTKHDAYSTIIVAAETVLKNGKYGIMPARQPPRGIRDCFCGAKGEYYEFTDETGPAAYLALCKPHKAEAKAYFVDGVAPAPPVVEEEEEEAPVRQPNATLEAFA